MRRGATESLADGAGGVLESPGPRRGPSRTEIRFATGSCSLGAVLVGATDRGACAILLGESPEPLLEDLARRFPRAALLDGGEAVEALLAAVVGLVERPRERAELPLDLQGTDFQRRVWDA